MTPLPVQLVPLFRENLATVLLFVLSRAPMQHLLDSIGSDTRGLADGFCFLPEQRAIRACLELGPD